MHQNTDILLLEQYLHEADAVENTELEELYKKEMLKAKNILLQYEALSYFSKIMRWEEHENLFSWADRLLKHLVPYLEGVQAVIYTQFFDKKNNLNNTTTYHQNHDNQKKSLILTGAYAVSNFNFLKHKIQFGEGILGQVAQSQEKLSFSSQFENLASQKYINQANTLVVPLIYNYKTIAVIEIVFAQPPQPIHLQILDTLSENIASHLYALIKDKQLQTSLLEIQESQERLQKFSQVISEGILFIQQDNLQIFEVNDAFLRMTGFEMNEVLGKNVYEFLGEKNISLREIEDKTDQNIPFQTKALNAQQESFFVEMAVKKAQNAQKIFKIVSFRDINKQITAEENLKESEERLAEAQAIVDLSKIIEQKNNNIIASINYAQRIQTALLPNLQKIKEILPDSFVFFQPRDIVSGDFYWFSTIPDAQDFDTAQQKGKIIITASDCTGHGVPGAFMSLLGSNLLDEIVHNAHITRADLILNELHKRIRQALKQEDSKNNDGMDIALCVIDLDNQMLEFAGAKNPLVYIQNEQLHHIKGDILPIGGEQREKERLFTLHKIPLKNEKGEKIPTKFYLYSDGFQDQFNHQNDKKFGSKQFREYLFSLQMNSMQMQAYQINQKFYQWKGNNHQMDDVLVIGVEL